jgi:hypothetical protein
MRMSEAFTSITPVPDPRVREGVCVALFAYEIGFSIDLDRAGERITALKERATIRHKRRAPSYFEYHPAPLRVTQAAERARIGPFETSPGVDILLYDFGAISVSYTIPFRGSFADVLALSETLYDNPVLLADSRRRVEQLVTDLGPAVARASIADFVETYAVFEIGALDRAVAPDVVLAEHAQEIAQVLRAERAPLSAEEIGDATAVRISFGPDDLALIDWEAAILFDRDAADVRDVLEFANVELLEMRYLDQQLDDALDRAYDALSRQRWWRMMIPGATGPDLRRVGAMQVESAILFEGVNNALKLLGDQYLARVYRLVSGRFHLAEWDASILRKLETLESIYQKLSDSSSSRRMEVLEWIIIVLIALSIVLPLVASVPGHR